MKKANKAGVPSKPLLYFSVIILVLFATLLFKRVSSQNNLNNFKSKIVPEVVKKVINNPQTKFQIGSVKDTSGIYEFELTINPDKNPQKYISYITRDGKILFTSGIKLETLNKPQVKGTTENQTKKLTCNDVQKQETPTLTAFIVSNCPYGLQMQRVFKKVLAELPQMINNLNVRYIGSVDNGKITSMHGDKEAEENLRQICIREEQKNKYWDYVSCYMQEGKTDECLATTGIDINQLKSCTDDNNRGLKYAKADFDQANKFGISGSPTLLVNDKQIVSEFDFGGRVPNSLKEIVCCGAKEKPDYCNNEISKDEVASSFSQTDVAGASTNSSGGCGN